jgi:uncharacterized membrane protein
MKRGLTPHRNSVRAAIFARFARAVKATGWGAMIRANSGNVAVMAALTMTTVVGIASLTINTGTAWNHRRGLQSANDAAALAAVIPMLQSQSAGGVVPTSTAASIVNSSLAGNGYQDAVVDSVTLGTFCPDLNIPEADRFTPGAVPCTDGSYTGPVPNAVRVTTHLAVPLYLAVALYLGQDSVSTTVSSTATAIDEAGFTAGTGLVNVDTATSPVLNAVLGGMLGTQVDLSAVSYQGLGSARVNALNTLSDIATSANLSVGSYGSMSGSSVSLGNVLAGEVTAMGQQSSLTSVNASALQGMQSLSAAVNGEGSLTVGNLLNVAAWQTDASATSPTALQAWIDPFRLATAAIQIANGQNTLTIPTSGLGLPGLASLTVAATAGTPAQQVPESYASSGAGAVGASMSTSQVVLNAGLSASPPAVSLSALLSASVSVNLTAGVTVANGTAALSGVACGTNPASDATVAITGTTSAATVAVTGNGTVTLTLLGVPTKIKFTLSANSQLGAGGPTTLTFTQTEIQNATSQRIASDDFASTTLTSLSQSLSNQASNQISVSIAGVQIAGLNAAMLTTITNLVSSTIGGLVSTLDVVVNGATAALGVQVGYMDVTATGVRCGVPALVK